MPTIHDYYRNIFIPVSQSSVTLSVTIWLYGGTSIRPRGRFGIQSCCSSLAVSHAHTSPPFTKPFQIYSYTLLCPSIAQSLVVAHVDLTGVFDLGLFVTGACNDHTVYILVLFIRQNQR